MGWNGNGTFSRLYSWVQDAANGLNISSTRMDADTNDIVTAGLGNCITRDGQGQASARIPFPAGIDIADGSVGAPAINFIADTDTGIYRIGSNDIGVSVGGTKVAEFSSAGIAYIAGELNTWPPSDGSSQTITYTGTDCRYIRIGQTTWISGSVAIGANANGVNALMAGPPGLDNTRTEVFRIPALGSNGTLYELRVKTIAAAGFYADIYTAAGVQQTNGNLSGVTLIFNGAYRL